MSSSTSLEAFFAMAWQDIKFCESVVLLSLLEKQ